MERDKFTFFYKLLWTRGDRVVRQLGGGARVVQRRAAGGVARSDSETRAALRKVSPSYQVSTCVAWSPDGIDGRHYDIPAFAAASDLLYVMDYDTRSQIFDACVAAANAPALGMEHRLQRYLDLGVSPPPLEAMTAPTHSASSRSAGCTCVPSCVERARSRANAVLPPPHTCTSVR